MTLHDADDEREVGVRALHDRLSEHLADVQDGVDIVVTRRGRPIARLTAIERGDPLRALAARGLVRLPQAPREHRRASVEAQGSVSDLVADQRR
jgi:prevent-host-death family protein